MQLAQYGFGLFDAVRVQHADLPLHALSESPESADIPFHHALRPLREAALAGVDFTAFHPAARDALADHLLRRLSAASAPTLQRAFEQFSAPGARLVSLFVSAETLRPADFRYRAFVAWLLGDGWSNVHTDYPVLAEVMAGLIRDWTHFCSELAMRVRKDFPATAVEELQMAGSDPHNGGREVVRLFMTGGQSMIYKPRSVAMEHAFSALLNWCNRNPGQSDRLDWYVPWVRSEAGYGWMEYVETLPCTDARDVRHFYRRAGGLAALLYLLGATDCHCENVVAHGRYPVLVDAETLLQPRYTPPLPATGLYEIADPRGWDTVARSGYLPRWELTDTGRLVDISGLSGGADTAARGPVWLDVNTDAMRLTWGELPPRPMPNLARLEGVATSAADWQAEVEAGFEETWRAVEGARDDLPLHAFAALTTRFIYRPTQLYAELLWQASQPESLRSPAAHEKAFDLLDKALEVLCDPVAERQLAEEERAALRRRDIPLFTVACRASTLAPSSLPFRDSPWNDVGARLRHWNEECFGRQKAIVRGSLRALAAIPVPFVEPPLPFPEDDGSAGDAVLLRAARTIADRLLQASFLVDGGRSWIALQDRSPAPCFQVEPVGFDLYGGTSGIAIFLAAAGMVLRDDRYIAAARETVEPLRRALTSDDATLREALGRSVPAGGLSGIGSVVYALARVGSILGDSHLVSAAGEAARLITPERIEEDRYYDIASGSAGTLCALLALWKISPDPILLARAVACGEHLLRHRTGADGRRAWRTFASVPLTGMGHGAAGIAMALLRLSEVTGDARMAEAAAEARAYEQDLFNVDQGNWPDLRDAVRVDDAPAFSTAWCHGAPGIGLSRLQGGDAASAREIDAAIDATRRFGIQGPDYICCGTMGRIDWLLEAGVRQGRAAIVDEAVAASVFLSRRAEASGGFRLLANASADDVKPGFFRGSAGIGYSLLRCARPGTLPCVLALD